MKRNLALLFAALSLLASPAHATLLLHEPFDYPGINGPVSTNTPANWLTSGSGNNDCKVAPGSLTLNGLAISYGNSLTNGSGGQSLRRLFGSPTASGTVYFSVLLRMNQLGTSMSGTNQICALMGSDNATFAAAVLCKSNNLGFSLGLQKNGTTPVMDSVVYANGQTLLLVGSYTFNSGSGNDTVALWINPAPATFELDPAPAATLTTSAGTDAADLDRFNFRQNNNSTMPAAVQWDELRVGTTWGDVTPAPALAILTQPASLNRDATASAVFTVVAAGTAPVTFQWQKDGLNLSDGGNLFGAATATLTLTNVLGADAGSYAVVITGPTGASVTSTAAQLAVNDPVIGTAPANKSLAPGAKATFTVSPKGTGPFTYRWQKDSADLSDGGNIAGATTPTLSVSSVDYPDAATYTVFVSNAFGAASASATLSIIDPLISSQPANKTANFGAKVTLSVTASGTGPLIYQWRKNEVDLIDGDNVSGCQTKTLTLNPVAFADSGAYYVVVTNVVGAITSAVATVTVADPIITTQPTAQTALMGGSATFSVAAAGTAPLAYQWLRGTNLLADGGNVSGATTATLTLSSVTNADETNGNYSVVVSGAGAPVTSSAVHLTVSDPPVITSQPANKTANFGAKVTLSVTATGAAPLVYQWRKDGVDLTEGDTVSGCQTKTLTLNAAAFADNGGYCVVITNAVSAITSAVATVTVTDPIITNQPAAQTVVVGGTATFSVGAAGTAPLTYQWLRGTNLLADGGDVSGATSARLTLEPVSHADATNGKYSVIVSGAGTPVTSSAVLLSVDDLPTITSQPANKTAAFGTKVTVSVSASSVSALTYQWRKNDVDLADGGNVSGCQTKTLTLNAGTFADNGAYCVVIANAVGAITSAVATVTVADPTIINQPAAQTVPAGSTVTFSVGASGTAPLSYQWRRGTNLLADGGNISGATTASLTLSSVSHADETNGKYSVVVSGAGAPVTSSSVSLSVDDPPAITAQPIGQTNSAGDFIKFTVSATGGDLAYQWRFNGLPLAGATKSSLSRTNVQAASAGIYSVEVTNVAGSVISADAVLALVGTNSSRIALWNFNSEPADNKSSTGLSTPGAGSGTATLVGGATADFRDGASSDLASLGNDNSAWELTDFPAQGTSNKLAGAQFAVSTLNYQHLIIGWQMHVTKGASKFYRFQYTTDGANFLDGELITVPVYNQFFYQAIDLSGIPEVNNNPNFGFRIVAEFESTALGSTNENYVTPSTSSYSSSSDLTLDMINIFGTLGTFPPPNILTQPQSCTNLAHSTATFSVSATTTDRLSYQWCKNGEALDDGGNVSGAATSTLTLADVSLADAADYTVVLTNGGGSVTSAVAQLTVLVPVVPVISSQPVNRTNEAGTTVVFTVLAANADSYQWFKGTTPLSDGGTISGAQTATLTILGAQPSDEGDYSVLISNASGSVSSAAAFLKVLLRQVPAPRIQSIQSAEGGQVTLTWSAESGATYRVQYKDQLDQAGWADLASEVVATGSTTSFTDTPGSTPRFYRILVVR